MRLQSVRRAGGVSGAVSISRRDFLKISGAGLAGAALLGAAGCGVFEQGGGQQQGGGNQRALGFDLEADIPDLNSTTTTDSVSFDVLNNVMEGLYRLDENEEPQPAAAEGVEISDDKLIYTFTLRDGVQWSNGDPVTSQDYRYAWLRAIDPDTAGQYGFIVSDYIEGGAEFAAGEGSAEDVAIETPDDRTLRVALANPAPFFLGLASFITYLPQQQEFTEKQGDNYAQSADALLYNGPYTLTQVNPANGATFEKNENYWDAENVSIQTVNARIVKDTGTRVNLYESGELDATGRLSAEYVEEYQDSPALFTQPRFATFWLTFNQENEVFQNENIRKAFQAGFDREALANQILNDGSVAATGFVPEGMAGPGDQTFREAVGPTVPEFDPEGARQLYEQGVEELGQEPTIEYLADDTTRSRDVGTFLQSQFQENIGANVEINLQPFDRRLELEDSGDFQMSHGAWIGDYNDPMTFLDLWTSDSPFNIAAFSNERYDQLISGAKTESDFARRMDMLIEAERILVEEQAVVGPSYFEGEARLIRPSVQNLVIHPYGAGAEFKYATIE